MKKWYYGQDTRNPYVVDSDSGERVCAMGDDKSIDYKNAKLCAAAPELLYCVEKYLELYKEMKSTEDEDIKRSILDSMIVLRKAMVLAVEMAVT